MKKKFLIIFSLFLGLTLGLVGCTSNKSVDQDKTDAAELTGDGDAAAANNGDAAKPADGTGTSDISDDFGTSGGDAATSPDKTADAGAAAAPGANDDLAGLDAPADSNAPPTDANTANPGDASAAPNDKLQELTTNDQTPPPTDVAPAPAPEVPPPMAGVDDTAGLSQDAKPVIPLQKVATAPFKKGKVLANAVYLARPNDTLSDVSQKIYGQDKTAELKKLNPLYKKRDLRVGDKVYYNSPTRSTDDTQMLTYYEDKGLSPEVYQSQPGDNIREVAKKLLGDKNSWKEVWATNADVESKAELPEGTRLRYWADAGAPAMAAGTAGGDAKMAANNPPPTEPPPPMPDQAPPPQPGANTAPVPPPQAAAPVAAIAPEPPPPPPPPAQIAPPPPPPPQMAKKPNTPNAKDAGGFMDDPDQMMALGVGAILLLAAVAMFIIIRKRRSKRNIDFQTATHTQIE